MNNTEENSFMRTYPCVSGAGAQCLCTLGAEKFCPVGSFCSKDRPPAACSSGFYCPVNSTEPVLCCPGFYCPSPTEMFDCPAGAYCRAGQIAPFVCPFLSVCPERNADPLVLGYWLMVFVVVFGFVSSSFLFKLFDERSRLKRVNQVIASRNTIRKSSKAGSTLDHFYPSPAVKYCENSDCARVECPCSDEKDVPCSDLWFSDVSYSTVEGRKVLQNVSGCFRAGRVCAIMGPSGCGKTTLLSLLCGKVPSSQGTIGINIRTGNEDRLPDRGPQTSASSISSIQTFRSWIGYIPQDDILLTDLSVIDTVQFSAEYRLDARWSSALRNQWISYVLQVLHIDRIGHSPIGDTYKRGVSGGERKRVNIAVELAANPSILLADEPLSGLDSLAALEVCQVLQDIARSRKATVVAVVHQPRPEIMDLFDDVFLLDPFGAVAYFGPRDLLVSHFEEEGHVFPLGHRIRS